MAFDLTPVTGALTALKALTGIAKDVNNIELNQKIIELQQKLLDIQIDYGNLLEENRSLKETIETSKSVEFHHSVIWKRQPDGTEAGPYCPVCLAEKARFMPLHFEGRHQDGSRLFFSCPIAHDAGRTVPESYLLPEGLIPPNRYVEQR